MGIEKEDKMSDKEIISLIEVTLNDKIKENDNYIRYSFFEVNVKYKNIIKDEKIKNRFIELLIIKLKNMNYEIHLEGDVFEYNNSRITVQCNEELVAVKKGL